MDVVFSSVFSHSGLCRLSPDGRMVANNEKYRIIVRNVTTLDIVQVFTCLDAISKLEWSNDSLYILAAQYRKGHVQVWSLEKPNWVCRIDEGLAGLTFVYF